MTRHSLIWRVVGLSVHPAAVNNDASRHHDNGAANRMDMDWMGMDNGSPDDDRAVGTNAACAIDAPSTDESACFHRTHRDNARCKQRKDHRMFHECSLLGFMSG
jgi:hypothetical protein